MVLQQKRSEKLNYHTGRLRFLVSIMKWFRFDRFQENKLRYFSMFNYVNVCEILGRPINVCCCV